MISSASFEDRPLTMRRPRRTESFAPIMKGRGSPDANKGGGGFRPFAVVGDGGCTVRVGEGRLCMACGIATLDSAGSATGVDDRSLSTVTGTAESLPARTA